MSARTWPTRSGLAAGARLVILAAGLAGCAPPAGQISVPEGGYRQSYANQITGTDLAEFVFPGEAGQGLVLLLSGDGGVHFDLYPPGGGGTLFSSGVSDRSYATTLTRDGAYTVQVYLVGPRVQTGATAAFTLDIVVVAPEEMAG